MQIEATAALLEVLTKLSTAAAAGTLSKDEAFELAALRFLTARALQVAARGRQARAV
jgi:hypothetical protein